MGGGAAQFIPIRKGGERQDTRDLLLELRGNGFDIVRTRAELDAVPRGAVRNFSAFLVKKTSRL